MGDAYFQGSTVGHADAEHYGSTWTRDELILLREQWRRVDLVDLAKRLGRTEQACTSQYYYQIGRPEQEQWQPSTRDGRAWQLDEDRQKREARPVNTIHDDEERWWEPDFYRRRV